MGRVKVTQWKDGCPESLTLVLLRLCLGLDEAQVLVLGGVRGSGGSRGTRGARGAPDGGMGTRRPAGVFGGWWAPPLA